MSQQFLTILLLSTLSFIQMPVAHAGLGESESRLERDRKAVSAKSIQKVSHELYSVHSFTGEGNTIHEYISQRGVVFAVSWEGRSHPDLDSLLGTYSKRYKTASKNQEKRKGRASHHAVNTDRLIVERSGHQGFLVGRAYDPSLIPAGVSADEIK